MRYEERVRLQADRLKKRGSAVILAVESSCDETAVAIVENGRIIRANAIASQIATHADYGGVVPEIASRMHVEAIDPLLDAAFAESGLSSADIDAVAVTCGPGLVGALLVGVSWAKAYAYAGDKPLIAVNHIAGHVSANYLADDGLKPPFICLVASGGHSHIVHVTDYGRFEFLGGTTDDAAGEAFDKVARVLGLPYPGGPLLDALADEGDEAAYAFPHPHTQGRYDFSFSGLKTAVINQAHTLAQAGKTIDAANWAASFRRCVVNLLLEKTLLAARDFGAERVAIAGGVAANSLLRRELQRRAGVEGLRVTMPPKRLCTDNAAMIGAAGYYQLMQTGACAGLDLNAVPALSQML